MRWKPFCLAVATVFVLWPSPAKGQPADPNAQAEVQIAASQRYFVLVNRQLDDVARRGIGGNYVQAAKRYEAAGDKIVRAPTAKVHPDLVSYAATAADYLRTQAATLRTLPTQLLAVERQRSSYYYQDPTYVNYYWGGWTGGPLPRTPTGVGTFNFGAMPGNLYYVDNSASINEKERRIVNNVSDEFSRAVTQMQKDRDRVRRAMIQEFGVNFPR